MFGKLLKHQVLDAEEQARNIILEGREDGLNLIAIAKSEAESIRRRSYQEGRDIAERELLDNILAIKDIRSQTLQDIEQEVLKLSVKIAEKIIGREISHNAETRGEIVLNALRQVRQQEMLTIRVNANDLPLVEQMREKIDVFGRAKYIDFVADQTVKDGGCVIESESGTIDARLETQLRILENALLAQSSSEEK